MEKNIIEYTFTNATVAEVWPLFARANCVFEHLGLEPYSLAERPGPDGAFLAFTPSEKRGQGKRLWREFPLSWVTHRYILLQREYSEGRLSFLKIRFDFNPSTVDFDGNEEPLSDEFVESNCLVRFTLEVDSSGLARWGCKHFVRECLASAEALFAQMQSFLNGDTQFVYPRPETPYFPKENLAASLTYMERSGYDHGYTYALRDFLLQGLDSEVVNLRPHDLVNLWNMTEREAMELCLLASKARLLQGGWHVKCPRTLSTVVYSRHLDKLPKSIKSPWVGGVYSRDFSSNVEPSFSVHPRVRTVKRGRYSFFSPYGAGRIWAQFNLSPNEVMTIPFKNEGAYRLQILRKRAEFPFEVYHGFASSEHIYNEFRLQYDPVSELLTVENLSDTPKTYLISCQNGSAMSFFSGSAVLNSQAIRDLFPDDLLHPEDEAAMSNVTVMFTDLRASTQMYESIGDARAFHLVRRHFDVLTDLIREHNGALVKTIGDAVMAVFDKPIDAVQVAMAIHEKMEVFNKSKTERDIVLKIAIHKGPCIAVTLNNRIDYFGATVNTAARLSEVSKGDDIVMSLPVMADKDVNAYLSLYRLSSVEGSFKGIDGDLPYVTLHRQDVVEQELQDGDFSFFDDEDEHNIDVSMPDALQ